MSSELVILVTPLFGSILTGSHKSPLSITDPPTVAVDEAVVKVRTGTSARLGCSVEAFPDPVIVWVSQDNRAVTNSKSPTQLVI